MILAVRSRIELSLAALILGTLCVNAAYGMQLAETPLPGGFTDPSFVRWMLTQGGLTVLLIVVLWSYRRDLVRIGAKDEEKIAVLTQLVSDNIQAMTRLTDVIERQRLP